MKKLISFLCAGIITATASIHAQTADEVVGKYLKAIGGEATWKTIKSIHATGGINAQGTEIKITLVTAQGRGFRNDYSLAGMSGYSIITPTAGWYYNPGGGQTKAEPMKEEQVKMGQDQLDLQGPLVDYKAKGTTIEYAGKENIEGASCYKLKLTRKSGSHETWYIDAATGYLIRKTVKFSHDGKDQEESTNFSSYQKLPAGIVYPMTLGTSNGEIKFTSVEINTPVDEKAFTPAG